MHPTMTDSLASIGRLGVALAVLLAASISTIASAQTEFTQCNRPISQSSGDCVMCQRFSLARRSQGADCSACPGSCWGIGVDEPDSKDPGGFESVDKFLESVPEYASIRTVSSADCETQRRKDFDPNAHGTSLVAFVAPTELLNQFPPFSVTVTGSELRSAAERSPALAMALLALDVVADDRIDPVNFYTPFRLTLPADLSRNDVAARQTLGFDEWYRSHDVETRIQKSGQHTVVHIAADPPVDSTPSSRVVIRIQQPSTRVGLQDEILEFAVDLHQQPVQSLLVDGSDGYFAGVYEIKSIRSIGQ